MNIRELMDEALKLAELTEIPFDSCINCEGDNIKKILMGVDMETAEILVARELGCDCVVSHHPVGDTALTDCGKIINSQINRMVEFGVPVNKAQKALKKVNRKADYHFHVSNYDRFSSAARLLNMPYMNIHQPADLIGERTVQSFLDNKLKDKPRAVLQDVIDVLLEMPEYKKALTKPVIRVGDKDSYAGKIAVLMAGGTDGGKDVHRAYFEAGVGTLVLMHVSEDVADSDEELGIGNVVVAGHMASDSVGLNKIIERWESFGIEVIRMAGIIS